MVTDVWAPHVRIFFNLAQGRVLCPCCIGEGGGPSRWCAGEGRGWGTGRWGWAAAAAMGRPWGSGGAAAGRRRRLCSVAVTGEERRGGLRD